MCRTLKTTSGYTQRKREQDLTQYISEVKRGQKCTSKLFPMPSSTYPVARAQTRRVGEQSKWAPLGAPRRVQVSTRLVKRVRSTENVECLAERKDE